MRVGIIPDEFGILSVRSVFQELEQTLAKKHELVRRSPEYFSASASRQKTLCEDFLVKVMSRLEGSTTEFCR